MRQINVGLVEWRRISQQLIDAAHRNLVNARAIQYRLRGSISVMSTKKLKKFALIGSLYLSQYIPAFFLSHSLPVLLRQQGLSLEVIGFLFVLSFPMSLRLLWSPLIDRYGFTCWGHYRFWIICFQLLIVGITVACAFLNVKQDLIILLTCIALLFFAGASQDIATDALAINL